MAAKAANSSSQRPNDTERPPTGHQMGRKVRQQRPRSLRKKATKWTENLPENSVHYGGTNLGYKPQYPPDSGHQKTTKSDPRPKEMGIMIPILSGRPLRTPHTQ